MPAKATSGLDKFSDPFLHPFSLKKSFGKRYRIQMEESWAHEKPENRNGYEGWYEQVPTACGGFIGLYQDKPTVLLQFSTPKQRLTCRKLTEQFKDTVGVSLDDCFDGYEAVLYFPPELFEQVAGAVGARKKRRGRPLTDAQKAAFAEGRKKGMAALKLGRNSLLSDLPGTPE
ncbi:MAG: hypothetical protein KJ822_08955 [Proteobacteria bacterium]|nr:hypothetical protein [Pseudomonadota bacterium]